MAHKGKLYPVAFNRDLTNVEDYTNLLPRQWVYLIDKLVVDSDPTANRFGKVSSEGLQRADGTGIHWEWSYHGILLITCKIELDVIITSGGRLREFRYRYTNDLTPGEGTCGWRQGRPRCPMTGNVPGAGGDWTELPFNRVAPYTFTRIGGDCGVTVTAKLWPP